MCYSKINKVLVKFIIKFKKRFICFKDDGWKLNRTNYYQEGWLATGNVRGIVGVTFTTSHCRKNVEYPLRTNYNLRGHRSDVSTYANRNLQENFIFRFFYVLRLSLLNGMNHIRNWPPVIVQALFLFGSNTKVDGP